MANKKLSREDLVISPKHPKWLDTIVADRHCDNDLYKIILFFGQHRINAKIRIIQWVSNKNCG